MLGKLSESRTAIVHRWCQPPMMRVRDGSGTGRILAVVIAVGLLVRLALLFGFGTVSNPELFEYDALAQNLNAGLGFVYPHFGTLYASYYPGVAYIGWTALLYAIFPAAGHAAVLVAQSGISALLAYVVYLIGRRLWDGRAGVIAAGLTLAHPGLAYYDTHKLHPLSFDTLMMALAVWALLVVRRSGSLNGVLLTGLVLGLAILQRGSLLIVAPLGGAWLWFAGLRGERWRRAAALGLGVVLALAPWVIRNYQVHGVPLLTTTNGEHFWIGNAPFSLGSNTLPSGEQVILRVPDAIQGADELEQNRLFWRAAMNNIAAEPRAFAVGILRKFMYFWTVAPQTGVRYPPSYSTGYYLFYVPLSVLALTGAWRLARRQDREDPLWGLALIGIVCLSVSLIHSVLYFELRHRWLLEPMLAILSAVGALWFSDRAGTVATRANGESDS